MIGVLFDGKDDLIEQIAAQIEGELDEIVDRELASDRLVRAPGPALAGLVARSTRCNRPTPALSASPGSSCRRARSAPSPRACVGGCSYAWRRSFQAAYPEAQRGALGNLVRVLAAISVFGQAPP